MILWQVNVMFQDQHGMGQKTGYAVTKTGLVPPSKLCDHMPDLAQIISVKYVEETDKARLPKDAMFFLDEIKDKFRNITPK